MRPCASFVPVACFSTVPLLRSHFAAPTRYCVGASCVRAGGGRAGLLWACLLAGGWVSCLRAGRVRVGVCVLWCWRRFAGGGGTVWSRRPFAPACLLACLRAHAFGVGLLACAQFCACPLRAGCNSMGRDMVVPPHTAWRALLRSPRGAGREKAGVLTLGVLTRAHAQRERERERGGEGEGSHVGRTVVDWLGAWVCAFWCMQSPSW